jgi:phosphoglycolate phosphatase-like HAD superfamily hydrolase
VIVDSFDQAFEVTKLARPSLTRERYRAKYDGNINDAVFEDIPVNKIDFFYEAGKVFKSLGLEKTIEEVIHRLGKEYRFFIVSSSSYDIIDEYLVRHGIREYFEAILDTHLEPSKVKKFRMIFDQYDISAQECLFISDTSGDIHEAKEGGVSYTVGITGGFQSRASLEKSEPDCIVENFEEFYEVVKKWDQ